LSASELKAQKHDINYIKLEGNIACLVNGAGLAMATMDLLKLNGGSPANFLDIGGGATADQVAAAIEIIGKEENVKVIYINIFGGIMRCDVIAEGIIKAYKKIEMQVPIVMRLKGNKLDEAKDLMKNSGLKYFFVDDFNLSAEQAIKIASK
jgi:succinyl-CoA synthetase beta subunit